MDGTVDGAQSLLHSLKAEAEDSTLALSYRSRPLSYDSVCSMVSVIQHYLLIGQFMRVQIYCGLVLIF